MRTLKLVLEYDGSAYHGWQVQPHGSTIQGELETRLRTLLGRFHRVHGAGRTDAGVHAIGQVAHFRTDHPMETGTLQRALNATLPRDIAVLSVEEVAPGFHARKSALSKQYAYHILNRRTRAVFWDRYAWHIMKPLQVRPMEEAARELVGTHDFSAFCATGCDIDDRVRTIHDLVLVRREGGLLRLEVRGNGFLRHMVRILVGTLVEVGLGKRTPDDVRRVLASADRRLAGKTAPARGLCLERVTYESPTTGVPARHHTVAAPWTTERPPGRENHH